MKQGIVSWISVILLALSGSMGIGYAEDICFTETVSAQMVVELQQCRIQKEQIELYRQGVESLEKQIEALERIVELKGRQVETLERAVSQYSDLLRLQRETYEAMIKESKPSFIERVTQALPFIAIGLIVGLAL